MTLYWGWVALPREGVAMARRWFAGITLVVLVLSGGVAGASPVPGPSVGTLPPAVAGITTLRGDSSATMNVRVPAEAVLDLTPVERKGKLEPKAMRVKGGRSYVGFLLTERSTAKGMFVVGARLPRNLTDGETVHRAIGYGQPAVEDRDTSPLPESLAPRAAPTCIRCRVPAGDYRLQLITMGKPATVEITFEGLRGSTSLRPSAVTEPFGFSGSFRAGRGETALADGGGMGLGLGWWRRESGVLLTTYQLDVAADGLPVAQADAASCRTLGREEHCTARRYSAGTGTAPSMAGFGALGGNRVKNGSTSLSFGTLGHARWTARASVLWLPTHRASNDFEFSAEAADGAEVMGTEVFR